MRIEDRGEDLTTAKPEGPPDINASRIPAAQHEGSLFAVFVLFVCLFVSLRKRTTKKKATSHRKGKMQKNSRYGFYSC